MDTTLRRVLEAHGQQVQPQVIATIELVHMVSKLNGTPSERLAALIAKAREKSDLAYLRLHKIDVEKIPAKEIDQMAEHLVELQTSLKDARTVLLGPHVSDSDKTAQIAALMSDVESFCTSNCDLVLKTLSEFNSVADTVSIAPIRRRRSR